jgi:hypothetical protein
MCVADEAFARRLCFGFLERIRAENVQKGKVGKSFLETEMARPSRSLGASVSPLF